MKQNSFPLILEPDVLRKLNDDAIQQMGAPIFFYAPAEISWPIPKDPISKLYAIITNLYVVYHDYGNHILKSYLDYCEFFSCYSYAKQHIEAIEALRNGLCHGALPEGRLFQTFQETLRTYQISTWPPASASDWQSLCDRLLPQLITESNNLLIYLQEQINLENTRISPVWPKWLVEYTMNPEHLLYGDGQYGKRFFAINLVWDIANRYPGEKDKTALSCVVQQWLTDVRVLLLNGGIENSDTLAETLTSAIRALYEAPAEKHI